MDVKKKKNSASPMVICAQNDRKCMMLELYKKHSPKYCTVRAYIENSFRALSRPPPAGFALMLGILDLNYLLFLIILLLSSTMLVV